MQKIFLSLSLFVASLNLAAQNAGDSSIKISTQFDLQKTQNVTYIEQLGLQGAIKKVDTSKLEKKTISQEIDLPKALDVLIDMGGEVVINTWSENIVKLETTVQFEGPSELTDKEWLDKMGISMKLFGSTVRIKTTPNNGFRYLNSNGTITLTSASPVFSNTGSFLNGKVSFHQPIMLYVPAESLLEIGSNYGRLKINSNIKNLALTNMDGEIAFGNVEKLKLRGNRGSITGGMVADADIELSHGRIALKQLSKGSLNSTYCAVEIEMVKDVSLNSSSDEIEIDEAVSLNGIKKYGSLRINQLTNKLDLQGINSDINLRHVNASAQLVKIINRNADLRLPVNDLSNFSVNIKGSYNKIYSFFSEKTIADTLTAQEIESVKSMTGIIASTGNTINITNGTAFSRTTKEGQPSGGNAGKPVEITVTGYSAPNGGGRQNPYLKYTTKMGEGKSQLNYEIVCISCVIDFK